MLELHSLLELLSNDAKVKTFIIVKWWQGQDLYRCQMMPRSRPLSLSNDAKVKTFIMNLMLD